MDDRSDPVFRPAEKEFFQVCDRGDECVESFFIWEIGPKWDLIFFIFELFIKGSQLKIVSNDVIFKTGEHTSWKEPEF